MGLVKWSNRRSSNGGINLSDGMHYSQITESKRSKKPFYRFNTIVGVFSSSKNPKKDPECHQLNTIEGEFSEATHSKKEKKLEKNPKKHFNSSTPVHPPTLKNLNLNCVKLSHENDTIGLLQAHIGLHLELKGGCSQFYLHDLTLPIMVTLQ